MSSYKSMQVEDARALVTQSLGQPYQEGPFRQLVSNILPASEVLDSGAISGTYIPRGFSDHIASYKRVAKIRGRENIDALSVKLKSFGSMVNSRAMQRRFIARYLNGSFGGEPKDAALVAFYVDGNPDWRFSLVYKNYTFDDNAAKTILSEPRRSSFLVGPHELTHTAEQQFVDLLQAEDRGTVNRLSDAFSVEKVTKEFFAEYKKLFLNLQDTIQHHLETSQTARDEFARCDIEASVYAKRLLGQVVFLYFLQKKGWLGVPADAAWGSGSRTWLRELFNQRSTAQNFFSKVLNPLFYEALATDRSAENHYYKPLSCRIPFLNGGLFEPIGGHDWQNTPVMLENEFFDKLFTIFNRYNFTVREDEPLESEVAVDPEMLGKVFEGLLDTSERRQSGAFYTPRHIVHYMCRESLIQYLDRRVNFSLEYVDAEQTLPGLEVSKQPTLPGLRILGTPTVPRYLRRERLPLEDIKAFIRQDELLHEVENQVECKKKSDEYTDTQDRKLPASVKNYARELDEALAAVKVCDPAIGSGAFAVGMMLEIVHARKILHDAGKDLVSEKADENGLLTPYELKRHAIGNSLYGVDIDASAVDIAKLRLWLSLVVDENDYTQIKPLPNLDYKIMVGNSLDSWRTTNSILDSSNISSLEGLRKNYFVTTDPNEKIKLKQDIAAIRRGCGTLGTFDWFIDFSDVLPTQKQNTANKNRPFGFDIVIGNPPYIQLQSMSAEAKKLKSSYQSFSSMGDIYCLFYELGCKLLTQHGVLAFITSNKWMRAGYGQEMRKFFSANTNPLRLIDFAGHKVFDSATVDVNIMILEKGKNAGQTSACTVKENCPTNLSDYIERNSTATRFETGESWAILSPIEQSIKRKIEAVGVPLKDWGVNIYRGILTGYNDAFIISGAKKDELIAADPKSAEIIRPILRGRDIKRYSYSFADLWVIAAFPSRKYDIERYPAVKKHLLSFGIERLEQTGKEYQKDGGKIKARKKTNNKWFETQDSISYWDDFSQQKIVWSDLARTGNAFVLDGSGSITLNTCYILTLRSVDDLKIKYLLSVLNSRFCLFYMDIISSKLDSTGYRWFKDFVEKIPVIKDCDYKLFASLVNDVLGLKILNKDTSNIENEIDENIYRIYGIDNSEIDVINNILPKL